MSEAIVLQVDGLALQRDSADGEFRIRDIEPTAHSVGTGDGAIFESLALRVAPLDGVAPTAAGQRG